MGDPFQQAYDPEAYRALGHQVVDLLADHLSLVQARRGPVLPWREPADQVAAWPPHFTEGGGDDPLALLGAVLEGSHHLQHPRYVGHQCAAPLPLASLLAAAADLLNNGTAVYEMGPVSTAMERSLVTWLASLAGYPDTAGGVLTHGGSAGNLTALLAARQAGAPYDVWEEGYRTPLDLCLVTSDQTHYSVARAARILGLGARGILTVATDARFRMRLDDLAAVLDRARDGGRRVLAVVASAGSTATGAVDPLEGVADLCEARGLWMHVDGAHGAGHLLSARGRTQLAGLGRSRSFVLDFHKLLMMPSLATAVVFRDESASWETFSQQASYLFDATPRAAWQDLGQRTLECTKRFLSLAPYLALRVRGTAFFGAHVDRLQDLATWFAEHLCARPGWEVAVPPEGVIVCFRHLPPGPSGPDLDALQDRIRDAAVKEGSFHLVRTRLRGATWLRTTLVNPLTTREDLAALLARLEALAAQEAP